MSTTKISDPPRGDPAAAAAHYRARVREGTWSEDLFEYLVMLQDTAEQRRELTVLLAP